MSRRPLSSIKLPPGILAVLTTLGYETAQDVVDISAETLSKELDVPLNSAEAVLSSIKSQCHWAQALDLGLLVQPPLTQAASTLVATPQKISTKCIPMDQLLGGGLPRGQVLELSGPPGSPKEVLLLKIVVAFVELGQEIVFLETQNMISPAMLHKALRQSKKLPPDHLRLIRFLRVHSLPDFMIFVHGLDAFLKANLSTSLLVVDSISYLFQRDPTVTISTKNMLLDQVKQAFAKACVQRQLTIATTSQLATKMLKPDGSPGTFDNGARGIMQPPLGNSYLPSGKSHRVIVIPKGRTSGVVKLITAPTNTTAALPYRLLIGDLARPESTPEAL